MLGTDVVRAAAFVNHEVVPLTHGESLRGALAVHDRLTDYAKFGADDHAWGFSARARTHRAGLSRKPTGLASCAW